MLRGELLDRLGCHDVGQHVHVGVAEVLLAICGVHVVHHRVVAALRLADHLDDGVGGLHVGHVAVGPSADGPGLNGRLVAAALEPGQNGVTARSLGLVGATTAARLVDGLLVLGVDDGGHRFLSVIVRRSRELRFFGNYDAS